MKLTGRALMTVMLVGAVVRVSAAGVPAQNRTAATDSIAPRTLDDYLALARYANASLNAAAARARAAKERIGVVRGYPDPMLEYGYHVAPEPIRGRQELIFRQDIPFPGKRGLRGEIASREAHRELGSAWVTALDLEYDVKVSYFELVRTGEVARVLVEERAVLDRMREISLARYSSGTAEQSEVLKLDVALAQVDDQITINEYERDQVRAHLNQLIDRDPTLPLPHPDWTMPRSDLDTAARLDSALLYRPEIAAARAGLEAAELSQRLARREYFPDLMLGFDWEFAGGEDAMGDRMDDSWEIMAGLNLPIWLGKRRAMSREADAMRESAEHGLEAAGIGVARDLEVSIRGVRAARERLQRFQEEILPRAEQAFASAEAGYRAGRIDFLDYLDGERMLLAMRREYYGVVSELGAQTAALERAVGNREQ